MATSSNTREHFATVIMAAGKGTRMKEPNRAKVLFELMGKPMIHYVADLAVAIGSERIIAIVGFQSESVMTYLKNTHPSIEFVLQEPQLGTGHAVQQSEKALENFEGEVLVLSGDVPLLTKETIEAMLRHHYATGAVATILTAEVNEPTGYGRIIRNSSGVVKKIVEHRDASPEELQVNEINSGIYLFHKEKLFDGLNHIAPHNTQNEYYLTDVFEYFWKHHLTVAAFKAPHVDEIQGVNTREQLEQAFRTLRARQLAALQKA